MSTLKVNEIQDTSGTVRRGIQTYAIICDQKSQNTAGGTATSGAWRTRDLNTEIADPDGIVSISSNQFTLGAGTYLIEAVCPVHAVYGHQARIYNATSSAAVQVGHGSYAHAGNSVANTSSVAARVSITGSTVFEIQHRVDSTKSNDGFGIGVNFGVEVFTIVKIYKEA